MNYIRIRWYEIFRDILDLWDWSALSDSPTSRLWGYLAKGFFPYWFIQRYVNDSWIVKFFFFFFNQDRKKFVSQNYPLLCYSFLSIYIYILKLFPPPSSPPPEKVSHPKNMSHVQWNFAVKRGVGDITGFRYYLLLKKSSIKEIMHCYPSAWYEFPRKFPRKMIVMIDYFNGRRYRNGYSSRLSKA